MLSVIYSELRQDSAYVDMPRNKEQLIKSIDMFIDKLIEHKLIDSHRALLTSLEWAECNADTFTKTNRLGMQFLSLRFLHAVTYKGIVAMDNDRRARGI